MSPRIAFYGDPTSFGPAIDAARPACLVKRTQPRRQSQIVAIEHQDKSLFQVTGLRSIHPKLPRKAVPYELIFRSTTRLTLYDANPAHIPALALEKVADECLMLRVFTQHHQAYVPAHCSQPVAITSESLSPT